jgi:hypothetical protein
MLFGRPFAPPGGCSSARFDGGLAFVGLRPDALKLLQPLCGVQALDGHGNAILRESTSLPAEQTREEAPLLRR